MAWQDFHIHKRLNLAPSLVEDAYTAIAEIDGVRNSWHIAGKLLPQTIERLTRSVIITSTGSSNRIEGNRLTDIERDNIEYLLSDKQLTLWRWATKRKSEFGRKDAIDKLGFPARTVESIIKKLVDLKRLERLGQGRSTRYKLI